MVFSICLDSVASQKQVPAQAAQTEQAEMVTVSDKSTEDQSDDVKQTSAVTEETVQTPQKPETENEKYVKNILASATKVFKPSHENRVIFMTLL